MGSHRVIVLDTHAWIWWVSDPSLLSKLAERAIRNARTISIPAIVVWEFAMLVSKGRLEIDRPPLEWVRAALALPRVELLSLSPMVAVHSTQLGGGFHGDPADRLIVASAAVESAPLVSKDERIHEYGGIPVIW
jgi:PIN domain nuclease of toxin-antitoxin system